MVYYVHCTGTGLQAAVQDYKCTPGVLFSWMTFYLDGKAPEAALTLH